MSLKRGAIVRFSILAVLLGAAFVAVRWTPLGEQLNAESIRTTIEALRGNPWAPLILIGLYLIVAPLGMPVSPLIIAGGVTFGLGFGWLYNFIGCLLGAVVSYMLGRTLAHDLVQQILPDRHIKRMEAMMSRHAFTALMRIRFIPVPFPVVNYGAALAGVRPSTFTLATALGLAPSLLVYTFLGSALVEATGDDRAGVVLKAALALGSVLLLTFLPSLIRRFSNQAGE